MLRRLLNIFVGLFGTRSSITLFISKRVDRIIAKQQLEELDD